jgi:type 1 fimbria pilin
MVFNNTPVKLGQDLLVINSAQAQESLTFNAHYYYNGGDISGGSVTSVTTFTFSYN